MAAGSAMFYLGLRPFDLTAKGSINRRKPLLGFHLMPRPPSEPRASRPIAERVALSLVVGLSADSQVVLIKFRFIRGATETIHLSKAVAATLLDGLSAAGLVKAAPWEAASVLNVNA